MHQSPRWFLYPEPKHCDALCTGRWVVLRLMHHPIGSVPFQGNQYGCIASQPQPDQQGYCIAIEFLNNPTPNQSTARAINRPGQDIRSSPRRSRQKNRPSEPSIPNRPSVTQATGCSHSLVAKAITKCHSRFQPLRGGEPNHRNVTYTRGGCEPDDQIRYYIAVSGACPYTILRQPWCMRLLPEVEKSRSVLG